MAIDELAYGLSETSVLRLPAVTRRTGLSRSTIYELISAGDFPRQIPLGRRAVGWIEQDIEAWISMRAANGRKRIDAAGTDSKGSHHRSRRRIGLAQGGAQ